MGKTEHLEKYQFKPGQSGNPSGKPKGAISPIAQVKKYFRENPQDYEMFIMEYMQDPKNTKHIVEMIDGKARQQLEMSGSVELPMRIIEIEKDGGGEDKS